MDTNAATTTTSTMDNCEEEFMKVDSNKEMTTTTTTNGHRGTNGYHQKPYKIEIVWRKVAFMIYLHLSALYGIYLCFTSAQWKTIFLAYFLYLFSGLGVGSGAHRLWSHRSYKATTLFRFILAFMDTVAFQASIFEWSRDHRVHHKCSETDGDPYNSSRGFFFSHMGWLMVKKHPDVIRMGKKVDISDLLNDKIVMFQHKYYLPLTLVFGFLLPTLIPYYLWNETLWNAWFVCTSLRICFLHHCVWLVNSAAHMWGYRPYDVNIAPAENKLVSIGVAGEGFHNYHHTFPWDYSASEGGWSICFNLSTAFLDLAALLGLVYDRKKVSPEIIRRRMERTGKLAAQ